MRHIDIRYKIGRRLARTERISHDRTEAPLGRVGPWRGMGGSHFERSADRWRNRLSVSVVSRERVASKAAWGAGRAVIRGPIVEPIVEPIGG